MKRTKISDPRTIIEKIDPYPLGVCLSKDLVSGEIHEIIKELENIQQQVKELGYDSSELKIKAEDMGYYEHTIQVTLYGLRTETKEEIKKRIKRHTAANKKAVKTKKLKEEADYKTFLKLQKRYKDVTP